MSGMGVTTGGRGDWHTFTVTNVIDGSPAEEAGVKTGDIIVSVDGKPATEFFKRDLAEMFHQIGRTIRFEFNRKGKNTYVDMKMRPML
jgi:serine protease DegQ